MERRLRINLMSDKEVSGYVEVHDNEWVEDTKVQIYI